MRAHHGGSALSVRNIFCSGHSEGKENHFESKCFSLKQLLLFDERVITYMKTVVWKCSLCVQPSSCGMQYGTGLCCGFLPVSKSFSTQGFVTGTDGIWQCQRWGRWAQEKSEWSSWEKHTAFCSLNDHTEIIFLSMLERSFQLCGHLKFLAAYSGGCMCRRKGNGYTQEGLWALFGLHAPLLNFSPAVWAQPERTLSWLKLSRILSVLGKNTLVAAFLT